MKLLHPDPSAHPLSAKQRNTLRIAVLTLAPIFLTQQQASAAPTATTTTLTITASGKAVSTVAAPSVVTLTATVLAGTTPVSPGQVNFCDAAYKSCTGVHLLATAQLTTSGTATFKFRPAIGSHSYTAVFLGTPNGASSTSPSSSSVATITVTGLHPSKTVLGGGGANVYGSGAAAPTGEVSYIDVTDGAKVLGTATISAQPGIVWLTPTQLDTVGSSMGAADFNGDGILDFVVSLNGYSQPWQALVYLGNGDGTFASPIKVNLGSITGGAIATGDFNGDGIQDFVVSNTANKTFTSYLGDGTGNFYQTTPSPSDFPAELIRVADVNRDGIADLIVGGQSFLGNGDGTFSAPPSSQVRQADSPSIGQYGSPGIGDFNGDGIPDFVYGSNMPDSVAVLLGDGLGHFSTPTSGGATSIGCPPSSVVAADFNGDGFLDAAAVCSGDPTRDTLGSVAILLGDGSGNLTLHGVYPAGSLNASAIAVGDFNGDGKPDVAIGNGGGNAVHVLINDGTGTMSQTSLTPAIGDAPAILLAADFDGDGITDLAAISGVQGGPVLTSLSRPQVATAVWDATAPPASTGTKVFVAKYSGDSEYKSSVSAALSVQSPLTTPAIAATSSSNPANLGSAITFTATVTGVGNTPTGTVIFYDSTTPLGASTLTSGSTTLTIGTLAVGTHSITAKYSGDNNYHGVTSSPFIQTVSSSPPAATPTFSPGPGTFTAPVAVTLSDATPGAVIYYSLHLATPSTSSTKYTGPIQVASTTSIHAIAVAPNYTTSAEASAAYTINPPAPAPLVFTPAAGTYPSVQDVAITTTTAGTVIYYTTGGSAPSSNSTRYTSPIRVSSNETIKAFGSAPDGAHTPATSASYTIVGSPTALASPATAIADTGVTLNAIVDTHGLTGSYVFRYGTSATSLTGNTSETKLTASTIPIDVSAALTSLKTKTTYFYQVEVTTAGGTGTGATLSFTTK